MVVGPTQSGKTCLAVGLAKSTNDTLVVIPRAGRKYLMDREKEFAESSWPGGTTTDNPIGFYFKRKGTEEVVEATLNDYKGETSTSREFSENLAGMGRYDGVALLVNPGFKGPYVIDNGKARLATKDDEEKARENICL